AVVGGCRLNPDLLERGLLADPAVGDAVERHPAGHDEAWVAVAGIQPAEHLEEHLFEPRLDTGGKIPITGAHLRARGPPRPEDLLHPPRPQRPELRCPRLPGHLDPVAVMREVVEVE